MSLPCDGNSSFTSTSQNCDDGPTADDSMSEELCIICDQPGGKKINFYKAATLGIDNKVRASAETLCDKDLIRKLSSGDMIAIDAHYHLTCLADLYRRSQKFEKNKKKLDDRSKILQDQALSDLIGYIESYRDTNTTFNMPELCKLYYSRLVSLGVEEHVHTTRLRESLLAAIPDLKEVRNERNNIVQPAFGCDISKALLQLSNHDCNHEIVILSKASKTLRQHVFGIQNTFSGTFSEDSQQNSVPTMLLSFMQMVLDGRGITGSPSPDKPVNKSSAALSISQLVVFNTVKHRSTSPNSLPRHIRDRETPIAIYIAIKIYCHEERVYHQHSS
ncbi:hypothetical protein RRG08_005607 [Elysia crispata]|uniref:Uncharacterized protein n=1 Tax=Elysia crispata TaxID=231223 RepID=A0AAE0YYS3_9GAST|nr:hypothetical protein RRG08_005607 [Elysia crispata]